MFMILIWLPSYFLVYQIRIDRLKTGVPHDFHQNMSAQFFVGTYYLNSCSYSGLEMEIFLGGNRNSTCFVAQISPRLNLTLLEKNILSWLKVIDFSLYITTSIYELYFFWCFPHIVGHLVNSQPAQQ